VEASDPLLGALLSAVGAATVAVYFVIGRHMRGHLSLIPYIWIVYGCAACILSVVLIVTGTPVTSHPLEGYFWIICLGLIPQLIGHSSLNYALAYLPATFISIATQAEPIGSAIIAAFVFEEFPGTEQVIGSAIILSGVIIASVGQSRHQAAQRAILAVKSDIDV
jgi:drug/metabolite transporter (DMT)-like permease